MIIPVYNVKKYLEQCLSSIIKEENSGEIEILVIDDGSTDGSGRIADFFAEKNSLIQVIHQENAGVAAARNTGMDLAKGEWLYFADSDDWLGKGAIGKMLARCRQSSDSDILLFDAWKEKGRRQSPWEHFKKERVWRSRSEIRALQRGVLYAPIAGGPGNIPLAAPWDKLYRSNFLTENKIRFHPELRVLDDMIFNMEAFGAAGKISYYKDRIYHYRVVPDSITNSYRPDRVCQDRKVFQYIRHYMERTFFGDKWEEKEKEQFLQAYHLRVIKSFSICCRLNFFHPENKKKTWQQVQYVKKVLETEPYSAAFAHVKLKNAEWRLKAVICAGRAGFGWGIYLLHLAQNVQSRL